MMKKQKVKSKSKWRKIILGAIVLLSVGGGGYYFFMMDQNSVRAEATYTKTTATIGSIQQTISGTGTLEPIEQFDITSLVQGDILEDYIEIGMVVEEDQILYAIDDADLDLSILKAENSLSKSLRTYENSIDAINDLTLLSDYEGVVTSLYVDQGDAISSNTKVADIVNSRDVITNSYYNIADAAAISIGQTAEIFIESTGEQLSGRVSHVASGETVSNSGAIVKLIEISFTNPGALTEGAYVTTLIGDYACNEASEVAYSVVETIYADASGDITGLYISEGDYITKGKKVLTLKDDDLQDTIESSQQSVEEAELSLSNTKETLGEYEISSPIAGTIVDKDYKRGDKLDDNKTTLAVVADMSKLIFTMDVDELDITTVHEGMTVTVTADAIPDGTFEGQIVSVGILGESSDGVSTYPVEVELAEYGGLLPGMNVNADIVAAEAKDVVIVPLTAVQRGNTVLVTEAYAQEIGATVLDMTEGNAGGRKREAGTVYAIKSNTTPEGYVNLTVSIGLNDDAYVEITSGLTEGAEVYQLEVSKEVEATDSESRSLIPSADGPGSGRGPGGGSGGQ